MRAVEESGAADLPQRIGHIRMGGRPSSSCRLRARATDSTGLAKGSPRLAARAAAARAISPASVKDGMARMLHKRKNFVACGFVSGRPNAESHPFGVAFCVFWMRGQDLNL
ncbi:hypothetical protein [Teichococcus aestuarii]|uniref:hypothetical protein n=1 Tax=Teichococcus aestuarii TaxID=568898 RepID=UPI00360624F1